MDDYEWYVVMYRREGDIEEHRLGPFTAEWIADKAAEALATRIDRERFYTRVVRRQRKGLLRPVP